ncbi:MAG: Wzz/FepE/Etk N-terminal domain-containing protein, partial [Bryobacteraceae bacterium]
MLWKSKLVIGLVWLCLCLLSVAVVYTLPATYKAEAVILVDRQKIPERIVASTVNAEVQDRLATISQQILATSRLQKIIVAFHLYERERAHLPQEDIIEMMRQDTKISLEKGWSQDRTGAFRISYQGRDPATVAEVANQIGNLFIDENLRTRETHAEGTSEFLEEQLQQAKKTLDTLEVQLTEYKLKFKGELPEQENALAGTLSRFELELRGNQDATNRAEQSKALLSTALSMAESTAKVLEHAAAEGTARKDSNGASSVKDAATLQGELDVLQSRYTDEHPDVQRLKQLLAAKKKAGPEKSATAPASVTPGNDGAGGGANPEDAAAAPDLLQQRERIAS